MGDYLDVLAEKAKVRIRRGYYDDAPRVSRPHRSLRERIGKKESTPIITEIKYASPSQGHIRHAESPTQIAKAMIEGGACGLSVLTDPDDFKGGLEIMADVAKNENVPILMKDILISPRQLEAGFQAGADAVVLISEIFTRRLGDATVETMIVEAGKLGLEVLAEANDEMEFDSLRKKGPDIYGINNRNLATFHVDLDTTEKILSRRVKLDRPVVSESGIESPADVRRLRRAGADAFLIGSSIMRSENISEKVKQLVYA